MTFGNKLRQLRQARPLTQKQFAKDLGVSQSLISSYESDTRTPDIHMLQRISDYFDVSSSVLMGSEGRSDQAYVERVADSLHKNPKLGLLFDRSSYLSETDLDAVLSIVNAISKERDRHE